MKRLFVTMMALMLVFGGVLGASAAEFGFHADLVPDNDRATLRGVVSGFYGEVEVGDKVEVKDDLSENEVKTDIVGTNVGIKLETEDPFYGVGQVNFGAVPLHPDDDIEIQEEPFKNPDYVKGYDWGYQDIEIGGGAEVRAFGNVDVGVEATLVNENPADLSEYSPNFSIFASLDFAAFPSPQVDME